MNMIRAQPEKNKQRAVANAPEIVISGA